MDRRRAFVAAQRCNNPIADDRIAALIRLMGEPARERGAVLAVLADDAIEPALLFNHACWRVIGVNFTVQFKVTRERVRPPVAGEMSKAHLESLEAPEQRRAANSRSYECLERGKLKARERGGRWRQALT